MPLIERSIYLSPNRKSRANMVTVHPLAFAPMLHLQAVGDPSSAVYEGRKRRPSDLLTWTSTT